MATRNLEPVKQRIHGRPVFFLDHLLMPFSQKTGHDTQSKYSTWHLTWTMLTGNTKRVSNNGRMNQIKMTFSKES